MKTFFLTKVIPLMAIAATLSLAACDDDDNKGSDILSANEEALRVVNTNYVANVVVPTYRGLADKCEELQGLVEAFSGATMSDEQVRKAGDMWKDARQYWEWSEAFLFGAAADYSIDPHIDTWPFDEAMFNTLMSKFNPAEVEADAAVVDHNVATSQNLTGFHALEYLIFRNGEARAAADLSANEIYFCKSVAADLYLNACKLEAAWAGVDNISAERRALLEEDEFEPYEYGEAFKSAGLAGSRWKTVVDASVTIIEGCQDIIGEVSEAKIGAAATGEDVSYIESPNAYNSIQDFYDNIVSCVHAFYGSMNITSVSSAKDLVGATGSLAAYCMVKHPAKTLEVSTKMAEALLAIKNMKAPFVLNYNDASAKNAMEALDALDEAMGALKEELAED